ncbi:hypothetical protein Tsubulata_016406, partial [Turnera subulata]
AIVTPREWISSACARGKKFVDLVLNSTFWKECETIVLLTEPLIRVLQIVDGDDRPAMGFLYEAIHKTRAELEEGKEWNLTYKLLIEEGTTNFLKTFILLMYEHQRTISGVLDVIEKYSHGNESFRSKLRREIKLFKDVAKDFEHSGAIVDRNMSGAYPITIVSYPNIEPNFISTPRKKKNRLEHQRLNDLVYVHYNLRLQQRVEITILLTLKHLA